MPINTYLCMSNLDKNIFYEIQVSNDDDGRSQFCHHTARLFLTLQLLVVLDIRVRHVSLSREYVPAGNGFFENGPSLFFPVR